MKKRVPLYLPSSRRVRVYVSVSAVVAIMIIGGVLFASGSRPSSRILSSAESAINATQTTLPSNLEGLLPAGAIKELTAASRRKSINSVTLENRDGTLIYTVTFQGGSFASFNAVSGSRVDITLENEPDDTQDKQSLPSDLIINTSFEKARQTAQNIFPNSEISVIELVSEGGGSITIRTIFTNDSRVDINAADGSVIQTVPPVNHTLNSQPPQNSRQNTPHEAPPKSPDTHQSAAEKPPESEAVVTLSGTLTLASGIYTLAADDGTAYTLIDTPSIRRWTDQPVQIKGALQADSIIVVTKITPLR